MQERQQPRRQRPEATACLWAFQAASHGRDAGCTVGGVERAFDLIFGVIWKAEHFPVYSASNMSHGNAIRDTDSPSVFLDGTVTHHSLEPSRVLV